MGLSRPAPTVIQPSPHVSESGFRALDIGREARLADVAAFENFYRENLARIVRACTLVTLNPTLAEDVAAEAFARLWSRWGQIDNDDHAGGFTFKTAMRLCARETKRHQPSASLSAADDSIDLAIQRQD